MKNKIITTLIAAVAIILGTSAYAEDLIYMPTLKVVSIYGKELKSNEIEKSAIPEGLKFIFTGDPVEDNNQKAIQVYCEVYKLQPGKYNLNFRIKGNASATSMVAQLTGKIGDEKAVPVMIGEFKRFGLTGEWQDAVLPFEIKEHASHGFFIMRVGNISKGGVISLGSEFKITAAN